MSLLDSEINLIDKVSIKELIIEWLKKYNIKNYKINKDLTIDVKDDIYLQKYSEAQLPDYIQFNKVNGWFDISCSQIKILKGCPKIVKEDFYCSYCENLESLEGSPEKVKHNFYCNDCTKLESLEGAPKIINGSFDCSFCADLKTLEGAPEIVKENFGCVYCDSLKTLKGAPEIVDGGFYCSHCPNLKITKLEYKKYNIIK